MRVLIQGQGASRGLALGRALVRRPHALDTSEQRIDGDQVESELDRLDRALNDARDELHQLRDRLHGVIAQEFGEFLDLHALILDDPELRQGIESLVRDGRYSAEYALRLQRDRLASVFEAMDDPYFRSRREDLDHVIGRVQTALHQQQVRVPREASGEILVVHSISPAELAQAQGQGVVAVVADTGSLLSHSAILARSLHLPLVFAGGEALRRIADGDVLMLDGSTGELVIEPSRADLRRYREGQREQGRERRRLGRLRHAPSVTRDGHRIALLANAESTEDVGQARRLGAAGVGLYRTEFLFLSRSEPPGEDEQFETYRDVVLAMDGRPVTLRTLDIGADKAEGSGLMLAQEPNPALGLRGIRLSLANTALFRTQLRAILRAAEYGPVRILLPMVSRREELVDSRRALAEAARSLHEAGHAPGRMPPLGAMIEVPAAALTLDQLRDQLDFVAVGTNDLIQYLLAADRNHPGLDDHYSPLHPALIQLLARVIHIGRGSALEVSVCGEIAADPALTPLLLALGLETFSLHPATLLEVREALSHCDRARLRGRLRGLLASRDQAQIERWLEKARRDGIAPAQ